MREKLLVIVLLVSATAAVYLQTLGHGFINLDDTQYVTSNPYVHEGLTLKNLAWAFTATYYANWHPLTWISHMLDVEVYGVDPMGHHLTNLVLHTLSVLLLFAALSNMTGSVWRSAFVAMLFAVHPVNTEPVAWVAERKGVLSTTFWMLTLYAYSLYVRRPGAWRYRLVVFSLTLGLLAKQMLVTMPFVLLLLDYWPLRRIGLRTGPDRAWQHTGPVMEKVPLFLLVLFFSFIAYLGQKGGGALSVLQGSLPLEVRLANAMVSYKVYAMKMVWPSGLAVYYPHRGMPGALDLASAAVFLVAALAAVIITRRRFPYLIIGLLWYLVTALPVIQLVQIGAHARADHYAYVPFTGLFISVAWGLCDAMGRLKGRKVVLPVAGTMVILLLMVVSFRQAGYWKDSETLFRHALEVTEENSVAHAHYGLALMEAGKYQAALEHFVASLRFSYAPQSADHYNSIGAALMKLGRVEEAVEYFTVGLQIQPDQKIPEHQLPLIAGMHFNLGVAYERLGRYEPAAEEYLKALQINPDYTPAITKLRAIRDKI